MKTQSGFSVKRSIALFICICLFLAAAYLPTHAQVADCNLFYITDIQMDSSNSNTLYVSIFNGDTSISHINYPSIAFIIDSKGDTVAKFNPYGGSYGWFYAHLGNTILTYQIPTTLDLVSPNFSCTVFLGYWVFSASANDICVLRYPGMTTGIIKDRFTNAQDNIKIFPNPFSTSTTIEISAESKEVAISIYDLFGKEVRRIEHINSSYITIERGNLATGMYFYEIVNSKKRIGTGKLIVQ